MMLKWFSLTLLLVSAVNCYPNTKSIPVEASKDGIVNDAIVISGSMDTDVVVEPIITRHDEPLPSPVEPNSVETQPENVLPASPARQDIVPDVASDTHDEETHDQYPFLESDVDYCLRRAATRFPPIRDPDQLTVDELRGVSKALRSTSCTRLLVRTMGRNGSIGNITLPTLPPWLNFTLPPMFTSGVFRPAAPPAQPAIAGLFQLLNFTKPSTPATPQLGSIFQLFNLTKPGAAAPAAPAGPIQEVQVNQSPSSTEAPSMTTASATPIFEIACVPCPPGETILFSELLSAINTCATQNVVTCCTCVFKATIRAIFSGGVRNFQATTAAPAASLARVDELDLFFFKK